MKRSIGFLLLVVLFSIEAFAEKPKEVIVSGQTAPLDVQIMPDAPVTLDPGTVLFTEAVPVAPARMRPFIMDQFSQNQHVVSRDSTLKFVNVTILNASTPTERKYISCGITVDLMFPPPNDQEVLPLANVRVLPVVIETTVDRGIGAGFPTIYQFLTGDMLVPAGSTLMVRNASGNSDVCELSVYGILFEKE